MSYRFEELGWAQFERLCDELLALPDAGWSGRADEVRVAELPDGVRVPGGDRSLPGPARVAVVWGARHVDADLVLASAEGASGGLVLGPAELGALLDARPDVRRRVPSVLGVGDLDALIPEGALARSTADVEAMRALAPVFVPTRAYAGALAALERHRFAVLTGPPEMGKTAIARTIGLALLTEGWEVHECTRPEQLWERLARDRPQLFVADDAFGSTEYRPEAAERWALDLDRALHALDERHRLIWTSRPSPLQAALRRIHREHGVERFPRPAEVQVAAAALDVEEKASILFRHARSRRQDARAVELVRGHGWEIVEHPHFTPERIRRFVTDRLSTLARLPRRLSAAELAEAVAAEIREPTEAMAASLRALPPEHRALLVALVDAPPGPVPERELAAAARRHGDGGLPKPPAELLDRLTDHFVRIVPPAAVTWVHPSWRDLVIDELAADPVARRRFLERCAVDGLLLALSTGGGAAGERALPLLVADADWDAAAARAHALVPELADDELYRLLVALETSTRTAPDGRARRETSALGSWTLAAVARLWDRRRAVVSPTLLEAWFALAERVDGPPPAPQLAPTWIELLPPAPAGADDAAALAALDDWLALVGVLRRHADRQLRAFGFPERQADVIGALLAAADEARPDMPTAPLLLQCLERLAAVSPAHRDVARPLVARLRLRLPPERPLPGPPPRPAAPPERTVVERILRDLAPPAAA